VKKETRLVLTYKLPEGRAEVKHVSRIRIDGSACVQLFSTSDGPAEIVAADALAWLRYETSAASEPVATVGALIH
jgi:hypothetical protein